MGMSTFVDRLCNQRDAPLLIGTFYARLAPYHPSQVFFRQYFQSVYDRQTKWRRITSKKKDHKLDKRSDEAAWIQKLDAFAKSAQIAEDNNWQRFITFVLEHPALLFETTMNTLSRFSESEENPMFSFAEIIKSKKKLQRFCRIHCLIWGSDAHEYYGSTGIILRGGRSRVLTLSRIKKFFVGGCIHLWLLDCLVHRACN